MATWVGRGGAATLGVVATKDAMVKVVGAGEYTCAPKGAPKQLDMCLAIHGLHGGGTCGLWGVPPGAQDQGPMPLA